MYYAVIFSSKRVANGPPGYDELADRMTALAREQPGFFGIESVRAADGIGITVSYWKTLEDIKNWKMNGEHLEAQRQGRQVWYEEFKVRICKVEREYEF